MHTKKQLILLVIIYVAFISLGLPDGLLGVAWPSIRDNLNLPLETMGVLTTALMFMSAFSSIVSGRVLKRFGTGGVTFVSGLMTGIALLGYALSPHFIWLAICTIPLGLGQGAVDSGLNLYVAKHYSARHMNWLHCFWGVGASVGPMIMTRALFTNGWRSGYRIVAVLQLLLSIVLLASLVTGLWNARPQEESSNIDIAIENDVGLSSTLDQSIAVFLFFLYTGIEFSLGIWLNSILIESRGLSVVLAGLSVTIYYGSIMCGRFLSGIAVNKIGNVRMIRFGLLLAAAGALLISLSSHPAGIFAGTAMTGLGLAPVYPCLMHETPHRFTKAASNRLIGYQVGAACLGGSVISSCIGVALSHFSMELLFPIAIVLMLLLLAGNESLQIKRKHIS